jgi:hypothetical protein
MWKTSLKQNNKNDTEILQERLPGIKERTKVEDLYVDGGYYGDKTNETAEARTKISSERRENTSKRAAIEGTNSALKRAHGASKLRVRGQVKSAIVTGMQAIGHNLQ